MSRLFHDFYVQPMNQVYFETIAIFVIWTVAMLLLRPKARRVTSLVGMGAALFLVLIMTVINRQSGSVREASFVPFVTFINAQIEPELYRTMYMNMLLFLPLGLSLPFVIRKKMWYNTPVTVLFALGLSACIEIVQYIFAIGKCEIDDVIMNTLGSVIGTAAFLICYMLDKCEKRKESKND